MISVASSIKFRKSDGLSDSFDNVQFNDEAWRGGFMHRFRHSVYSTDTITIQVKVTNAYTIKVYKSNNCWGPWTQISTGTLETNGTSYDYYEFDLDMSTFAVDTIQFKVEIYTAVPALSETWISEPVEILSDADDHMQQVEFFNQDNAFEVDYTTGIAHMLRVPAQLKEYRPGGEVSVFDNQSEVTKIKDDVKRILVFKTEPIPRYLAEMLRVAVAHDRFYVNEVEFVADALPEVENTPSNLVTFTCNLTQRNVIGLNTHDTGFDCDTTTTEEMIHYREDDASGQKSFSVPEGYLIAYITGYRTAGSPVITAGTTPGGTEVLAGMSLNATDPVWETAHLGIEIAPTGDATLYVTVSGAGATADLDVLLIYNRQA